MSPVRLEPMTPAEFGDWSRHSVEGFAAQQVASGLTSRVEAEAYAAHVFVETLPQALATPAHRFWTARAEDGSTVGHLWLRLTGGPDEVEAYVFDVEIVPAARSRGLGRVTMLAAEAEARRLGATVVRLNVFGHNKPALALYDGLGYTVACATLTRRLAAAAGAEGSAPGVGLRQMTGAEYADARSALDDVAGGALDRLLPRGPATTAERLWVAEVGGAAVGRAWLSLQRRSDGVHGLVRDLEVRPELRGEGRGRSIVQAVERAAQGLGVLTLTVSSTSDAGRRLFAGSGFELTAQTMTKAL